MPAGKIRNSLVFEALRKFSLLLGYNSEKDLWEANGQRTMRGLFSMGSIQSFSN